MIQVICIAVAFIVIITFFLVIAILRNNDLDKEIENHKRSIKFLEDRIAYRDREGERNFKDLVAGIDGVTSVSLSAKRYVELLRAENDLVDLKVKVRKLDNG